MGGEPKPQKLKRTREQALAELKRRLLEERAEREKAAAEPPKATTARPR